MHNYYWSSLRETRLEELKIHLLKKELSYGVIAYGFDKANIIDIQTLKTSKEKTTSLHNIALCQQHTTAETPIYTTHF